jgi:hypothetical protein
MNGTRERLLHAWRRWLGRPRRVRVEQAVYGSFPFWDRGYALLGHSAGCRPEWRSAFEAACQRFGERPRHVREAAGLFALRVPRGPWMIVGVGDAGADDRGRPGALVFHGIFVSASDYKKIGAAPFPLMPRLRRDWGPGDTSLPSAVLAVRPFASDEGTRPRLGQAPTRASRQDDHDSPAPPDGRAAAIAAALARGRCVALAAPAPIDVLARDVWAALPRRLRARRTLATWAFALGNRFDLAALPRLAGAAPDDSYLDPDTLTTPDGPMPLRKRLLKPIGLATAAASLALLALGSWLAGWLG